jgi:hypothetical protein
MNVVVGLAHVAIRSLPAGEWDLLRQTTVGDGFAAQANCLAENRIAVDMESLR